jgi:hypothetical protein
VARSGDVTALKVPGLARAIVRNPVDGVVLARAAWRLRRDGWWRRAPFLPLPDESYWAFRMTTAMGEGGAPTPSQVVQAARWAVRQRVGK